MAKVNRKWHDKNRLPKRATTRQRIDWHMSHTKQCACRPIPAKIQRAMEALDALKPKKVTKTTTKKTPKKK